MKEERIKCLLDLFHRVEIRRCALVNKADKIKKEITILAIQEADNELKQSASK